MEKDGLHSAFDFFERRLGMSAGNLMDPYTASAAGGYGIIQLTLYKDNRIRI